MAHNRLLAYDDGVYNDDDYHKPNKEPVKNRSKEYDILTTSLQTGNKEYGLYSDNNHQLESPKFARSSRHQGNNNRHSNLPFFASESEENFSSLGGGKGNYGQPRLLSRKKDYASEEPRSPKFPQIGRSNDRRERNMDREYDYGSKKHTERGSRDYGRASPTKGRSQMLTQDTIRVGDIKKIDLLLTLNDDTTIVVKAVPFKQHHP